MRPLFGHLLQRLGFVGRQEALIATNRVELRIEPGSTLDTIAALNPSKALAYADAVACDIKQAIANCTIGDEGTTNPQILEQIHNLKNAVAPTGSQDLLKCCEELRLDASRDAPRSAQAQRFMAVAGASTLLLRNYRRALSRDTMKTKN